MAGPAVLTVADTIARSFLKSVETRGDRPAIREKKFGIWQPTSWREWLQISRDIAFGLHASGFRPGDVASIIANAVPDCDVETLGPLLEWIVGNLGEDLSVETLARHNHMSARTFARRFRAETGTTPHAWVTRQRVQAAEELLERTDHSIEWIAAEVGFGNAATLRHHFSRVRGISPQQYRRRFAG